MLYLRLLLIFFIILCLVTVFNPPLAWKLKEGWKFKNAQPSDLYLLSTRIGGIIGVIMFTFTFFII
ncbi:MAG: DUF6199 family natural product biosynthesis protein [Cyanobacteria bacterium P01_D01_bin.50]